MYLFDIPIFYKTIRMTLDEFRVCTRRNQPDQQLDEALTALWHDAQDDWNKAHDIAQDMPTKDGSWIHAYLHRKEGDLSNAGYWYRKANREIFEGTLEEEWEAMAQHFLKNNDSSIH